MDKPRTTFAPGVKRLERWWGLDVYLGRAEDLIAAGLITADQLPGRPGENKTMRTFYEGVPRKPGANGPRDERYLSIKRIGDRLEVTKGVPKAVADERRAAERQREAECEAERHAFNAIWAAARQSRHRVTATQRKSHLTLVWSAP